MKTLLILLAMVAYASADDFNLAETKNNLILSFSNFTSNLVAVNTQHLISGLIFFSVFSYAAAVLYFYYLDFISETSNDARNYVYSCQI